MEDDELYEIPQWTPALLGWSYPITEYDDNTADAGETPECLTIAFDGQGTWSLTIQIEEGPLNVSLVLENEDIDDLFEEANDALIPLAELFLA